MWESLHVWTENTANGKVVVEGGKDVCKQVKEAMKAALQAPEMWLRVWPTVPNCSIASWLNTWSGA